jgi:hypothetical protein
MRLDARERRLFGSVVDASGVDQFVEHRFRLRRNAREARRVDVVNDRPCPCNALCVAMPTPINPVPTTPMTALSTPLSCCRR